MTLRSLAFFLIPILLLGACHSSRPSEPEDNDTQRYDEAYAMANFLNEPRQAMLLIDSAFEAQNITDERRQYLKAIVMYNGFSHPDSSLLMCRHLVESDEWEEVTDTVLIVDVYSLMSTVAGTLNRHVDVIHYAQLAYDLVHGNPEFRVEENDFLSRVGRTQAFLGQKEEGLENIRQAYNNVKDTKSWPALMTSLNIGRKLANTLREMNRANEALPLIRELINKLEYFSAHTEEFSELQASMRQSRKAVDDYVDYLRVRCYGGPTKDGFRMGHAPLEKFLKSCREEEIEMDLSASSPVYLKAPIGYMTTATFKVGDEEMVIEERVFPKAPIKDTIAIFPYAKDRSFQITIQGYIGMHAIIGYLKQMPELSQKMKKLSESLNF